MEKENKWLSIIIPVYNVEKYVEKCVKSVMRDSYNEYIEVILIDDGSTDLSGRICDKLETFYKNIKVIHKNNEGLSEARNVGLSCAKGDYVMFLDSDDMIVSEELEKAMVFLLKDYDIIIYDWKIISEKDKILDNKFNHVGIHRGNYISNSYIKDQIIASKYYWTVAWQGIYRTQFIKKNKLYFKKGIYHEDDLWFPEVILKSYKIFYIESQIYLYRMRNNSITKDNHKNDKKHLMDIIYIYDYLYKIFPEYVNDKTLLKLAMGDISKRYLHAIYCYRAYMYSDVMKQIDKRKIWKECFASDKLRCMILRINCVLYCKLMEYLKRIS